MMLTKNAFARGVVPARRPAVASVKASACSRTLAVRCRAELNNNKPLESITSALDSFVKRYDVVSCSVGALLVTSWCVYAHGQDPWTAMSITFTSTVVALVANELLFEKRSSR